MTAALPAVVASLELVKEQLEVCRKAIDKPSIVDNYQEYLLGMHIYTMINNASVALEILSEMGIAAPSPTPSPVAAPERERRLVEAARKYYEEARIIINEVEKCPVCHNDIYSILDHALTCSYRKSRGELIVALQAYP